MLSSRDGFIGRPVDTGYRHRRGWRSVRRRLTSSLVGRIARRYDAVGANNWAAVIAWNALFAFVPMILAMVATFSLLIGTRDFQSLVRSTVNRMSTSRQERADLISTLFGLQQHRSLLLGAAAIGLLWAGSGLFAAIDNALSAIYGVAARPFVRKRIRGAVLMLLFSVLMTPLLLSSAVLSVGQRYSLLPSGVDEELLILAQFVAGLLIATVIFLVIFRFLPNRGHNVRRMVPGALASGLLLEALTSLFPLYERATDGAATYGVLIALLFLLLTFFFLLGQITVIGALVNVELDAMRRGGEPPLPSGWKQPAAVSPPSMVAGPP